MNYLMYIIIPIIILYVVILIYGLITGELYTKWGIYTEDWFIDRDYNPILFWGLFILYLAILIVLILLLFFFVI
jgi:hypothetical protein